MSLAEFDVTGQKVLLVGAGRGIGKGIALAFAEAGADVAITSLSEATVGKVAEEVRAVGRIALPVTGDATKISRHGPDRLPGAGPSSVTSTPWSTAWAMPSANRWRNCPAHRMRGMTEDEWNHVVNINLTGGLPRVPGRRPPHAGAWPGLGHQHLGWASFRAGLVRRPMTRPRPGSCVLPRVWPKNGRLSESGSTRSLPVPFQTRSRCRPMPTRPGRRLQRDRTVGTPGEVEGTGYLCVFLASPAAAYITGQTWAVDGGVSIKHP